MGIRKSIKYFDLNLRKSTSNFVYPTNLFDIASMAAVSGNTQIITSAPDTQEYNRIRQSFSSVGGRSTAIHTVLEDGENRGLVSIEFGNILTGPGGVPTYSTGLQVDARQTGFQSSDGISFQSIDGSKYYYLSTSGRPQPSQSYVLANDGTAGVFPDSVPSTPCFVTGSLILTKDGEVPIEKLRAGDIIITNSGLERTVRWIGTRNLECHRHPTPEAVWPVRILKDAFGPSLPARDLWLSPDHSVCVRVLDEVLIPVKHLVNDATIAQVKTEAVTYWHVELDAHDILLAEGLPTESFLDTGVRNGFENAGAFMELHPDFSPLSMDQFCLPLVQEGPIVDAVRVRLLARAAALGWTLTDADDLHVLADGVAIQPEREGAVARFTIPAGTVEARLVSRSFVPEYVRVGAGDGRRLGVPVRDLRVSDEQGVTRSLRMDSKLLADGFSHVQGAESSPWRWTTGAAILPPTLWADFAGVVRLMVETAPDQGALQAWIAPSEQTVQIETRAA